MDAGSFCWVELATPDPAGALRFYHKLFGWEAQQPPDAKHMYTIFQRHGEVAAGCFQLPEDLRKKGVPPHWLPYVAVGSAEDATRRATELGGSVVREPFQAQDMGRLAVIQDPTGAVFAVWQAQTFAGFAAHGNSAFCWAELSSPDPKRAAAFYGELFGWRLWQRDQDPAGYWHVNNGESLIGGMLPLALRDATAPPHWLAWFQVPDCDAAVEAAEANGASIRERPHSLERVGRMAVIVDPQGAALELLSVA